MARLTRIAGSFALVLVAYWAYGVAALPWIEPPAVPEQRSGGAQGQDLDAWRRDSEDDRLKALVALFSPKEWEQQPTTTNILESAQAKLLFRECNPIEGGRLQLVPCTIVFMPIDAPGDNAERIRRAIVLRAASLEVDQIDPDQFNVRRLRNGRLVGPVTLRSTVKTAEGDQELRVVGSDVDLTEEGIWTPNDVNFRLGPSFGRGARMRIRFAPAPRAPRTQS